jgi:inosose dehydratase
MMEIMGAPGCWGVEDCKNPHNPDWKKVLDEAAEAGYKGLELGPYGYMPLNFKVLDDELKKRGLQIVAGTMYDDLSILEKRDYLIKKTKEICELISKLEKRKKCLKYEAPYLVVIDAVNPVRSKTSGLSDEAIRLNDEQWNVMMENIKLICKVAKDYGIRPVLHPHAGGYIEFADEIERVAKDLDNNIIGFCLDTGHLYYSGMNPIEWLDKYWDRVDYIHFKDVNKEKYEKEIKNHTGFFEACALGVMCPIGQGDLPYENIYKFLKAKGYEGYITIEQERDPRDSSGTLEDVRRSIEFLKKIGF